MTRSSDPHQRFDEWLLAGAPGEPARDLALHASLCSGCATRIATLDLLAAVDPGLATALALAAWRPLPAAGLRGLGRYAEALAGAIAISALMVLAGSRLVDPGMLTGRAGANAGGTPGQAVLGGIGQPPETSDPSASAAAAASGEPSVSSEPGPSAGVAATPAPHPANLPGAGPPATTPRPQAGTTPAATPGATSVVTATPMPTPTPDPTPDETPTPPPDPTPDPTPDETPTPDPTPLPPA